MHVPSVSSELANAVRRSGSIQTEEFGKLILHWFPAMWSLLWTMERKLQSAPNKTAKEEDDTVPIRILKALVPQESQTRRSRSVPPSSSFLRIVVPDMVGDKGMTEVHSVMASDAMRRCAEAKFHFRFTLESEEALVVFPEGVRAPAPDLPPLDFLKERYGRACDQVQIVYADMLERKDKPYGCLDTTRAPKSCEELQKVMAIEPYRLRLEREHRVHLAYQWPGILACVPQGSDKRLELFRSSAEQILAIHKVSA